MVQYFGATFTIQQFDHIFSFTLQGAAPIEVSHGHGSNGGARHASGASPIRPEIPEPLPNVTVAVGREATLPCVVRNLKDYKVIKNVRNGRISFYKSNSIYHLRLTVIFFRLPLST